MTEKDSKLSLPTKSDPTGSEPSPDSSQSLSFLAMPQHLLGRLYLLAVILAADCLALASIPHAASFLGPLAPFGIVSFAIFVGLGYSRLKTSRAALPFGRLYFLAHLICILFVAAISLAALHGYSFLLTSYIAHLASRITLLFGILFLALACIPMRSWTATLRSTSPLWIYSALGGILAWFMRYPMQSFWNDSTSITGRFLQIIAFRCVGAILRFFLTGVIVDATNFRIGTPHFSVIIAEACSGMEGLGLVLVFTFIWLWYFRHESRFPQALLLVPCALICVWMLNIVRIAALVLIGNVGGRDVAMVGFHSQAGWIAFTAVAFGFSMATRRLAWVRHIPARTAPTATLLTGDAGESPATAAYLVPFLAILGASFVSKAASGYFEWLYPLRFVAAIFAIWYYRGEYKKLNWRFGWAAPITGLAIAAIWLIPTFLSGQPAPSRLGTALGSLSPVARIAWITFRIAAAVITVPIAEELAFRGYLARRLMHREFDTVSFASYTVLSITVSSLGFGLMHGQQWIVGTLAGLAFAGVLRWRGRFGDAVVAHAMSNLLLAIWVISREDWAQW